MEEVVIKSGRLSLVHRSTARWEIFRVEADDDPEDQDLTLISDALSRLAGKTAKPVCVVLNRLQRPTSRMLAAVAGLLDTKEQDQRRVALARVSQGWLDMLEIVGLRSCFLVVERVEELTSLE